FRLNVTNAGIKNNAPDVIVGTAIQSWQPGVLKVKFQGAPVYGTYKVLDTDYTSYASVYSCINFFLFKIEFAWVLTRDTIPTPEISAMAEKVFTDRNINTGLFVKTVQAAPEVILQPGPCEEKSTKSEFDMSKVKYS
ncbi:unnamed protein product, partial [Notodromas monacha]